MKNALIFFLVWSATIALTGLALASPSEQASTATPSRSATVTPSSTITATRTITTSVTPSITLTATRRLTATTTLTATATPTATPTTTPYSTPVTATTTPPVVGTLTPTPIRYALPLEPDALSIQALRARPYGGSGVKITRVVSTGEAYKQVLIEYSSDGLRITGVMNIPRGLGPFPVVIMDHGYFKPAEYKTGDGTSRAADAFARGGYLTIAPDYRCYAGSQCGANPFYIGYAIDVLNLIAQVSSVPDADPNRLGIWGHSMGGEITLRVLTLNDSIKVASLYGALTGDDEVHYCWLRGCQTTVLPTPNRGVHADQALLAEIDSDFLLATTPSATTAFAPAAFHEIFLKSSASRNLANITAATIIHHGEADDIVPIQWSIDLANSLKALGKTAVLYTYPDQTHVFAGWGWQVFMARTLSFFDERLKPREAIVTAEQRVLRQERVAAEASY
jgi:uncharacterized protein